MIILGFALFEEVESMIIILDEHFPVLDNKSFLTHELNAIAKNGERTIIYPFSKNSNGEYYSYTFPRNICVREVCIRRTPWIIKLFYFFKAFFVQQFWQDIELMKNKKVTLEGIKESLIFAARTELYSQIIFRDIKKNLRNDRRIVLYSYWMHVTAGVASKIKQRIKNSFFVTRAHGYDLYEERHQNGFIPGRRLIISSADLICPVSKQGADYLKKKYPWVDKKRIKPMYLGTFDHGLNDCKGYTNRIVSCSNIVQVKRIELIVKALSKITDMEIEWVHYGDGDQMDRIKSLANEKIPANIKYRFAGEVINEHLMMEYKNKPFSYLINVSESEGVPVSMMESMSFGIPVIATNVGGVCEIVNEENGFLVEKDISPEQLSDVIRNAINISSEIYKNMRIKARRTWEQRFDANLNYKEFYRLISYKKQRYK